MKSTLQIGEPMVDFEYEDAAGVQRKLSESWQAGPAVLIWPRHRG